MAKIKSFQALHYNENKFKDFSKLVCPPYDVISADQQAKYHDLSEFNMIRLILAKARSSDKHPDDKYVRARSLLNEWIAKNVLVKDTADCVYVYEQKYLLPEGDKDAAGKVKTRVGFIALLRLDPKMVRPHEHTHAKPKEDRLRLLKQVKANLSPIFALFPDTKKYFQKLKDNCRGKKPLVSIIDRHGIMNKLWRLNDPVLVKRLSEYMEDKDIFIADGHHRFEVACMYRDMLKDSLRNFSDQASYNYIMSYFTPMESKELAILPTHRLLKNFAGDIPGSLTTQVLKNKKAAVDYLKKFSGKSGAFVMYFRSKFYALKIEEASRADALSALDVSIFNRHILKGVFNLDVESEFISYTHSINEAVRLVNSKKVKIAFLLNPTKINQLKEIVLKGKKMPPKSTYFYPKLLSGLLIHKF